MLQSLPLNDQTIPVRKDVLFLVWKRALDLVCFGDRICGFEYFCVFFREGA